MPIIPHLSQTMQTLLTTTTESIAATLAYVKRPDRAKFTPSTLETSSSHDIHIPAMTRFSQVLGDQITLVACDFGVSSA